MAIFCPNCGAEQQRVSRFCRSCGFEVNPLHPPPAVIPQKPSPLVMGGFAVLAVLLALILWQLATREDTDKTTAKIADVKAAAPVDKFKDYRDQFLSADITMITTAGANVRTYPSPEAATLGKPYPAGTTLTGRWVSSVNTGTKWLKVKGNGGYVWEGGLADPTVYAANNISFSRYVGKYPFNRVGDYTFIDDPKVLNLARAALPDPSILREMDVRMGTATPIRVSGDRLLAFGCENQNCGGFNWSMVITEKAGRQTMRICYHDAATMGLYSNWYENGRFKASVSGACPSELSGVS